MERAEDLVDGLLDPAAYPWRPAAVELIETHISWVFMAGDRVVKVKRPVAYGFVDHTTLARRERSCRDEARLNRRLTDGVYLDVAPIVRAPGGLRVGGAGDPVEWATVMRRLPANRMLDALIAAGAVPADLADRLAARLIPFHRDAAAPCPDPSVAARIVAENLDELAPFAGGSLAPLQFRLVAEAVRRLIAERSDLLRARAAAGWIREGHGDLRAEHVCLEADGSAQIFDCVEFNRDVRCADVASDLAFLLMDLRRLGQPRAAAALVARYRAAGIDLPDELLRFYGAHRALVRAKVACLQTVGAAPAAAAAHAIEAADYLDLAGAAALTAKPTLVAMTGLSGTGKSTVARRLGRALGARVYASDVERKRLAGIAGAAPAAWGEGVYAPEWTEATYDRLLALAAARLAAGAPVVLDATFLDPDRRAALAAAAERAGAALALVETVCDEATVAARLAARARRGDSPSDATLATYRRQRAAVAAAPPPIPPGALAVRIDTSGALPISLDPALAALERAGLLLPVVPTAAEDDGAEEALAGS